jgi:hypothetical protein
MGAVGLAFLFPTFILPGIKIVQAARWNPTPCVILSSSVGRHSGRKGSTYSVDIVYNYVVGNHFYTGKRYQFLGGSTGGYAGKAAIVNRYRPGKKALCYVNPNDPADSVINRDFTPDMWIAVVPLIFIAVAASMVFCSRRLAKRPPATQWQPASLRHAADFSAVALGPRELIPSSTRLGKLVPLAVFALAFYFPVVMMITQASRGWQTGHTDWGLVIFSVPFALVAIGMTIAVFYNFLALFNPRVHLVMTPGAAALGDTLELEWTIHGRVDALSRLRIVLEGREEATYRSGKNMATSSEVFSRAELVNTSERGEFPSGRTRATPPRNAMHSLETGHNKILWVIRVEGEIPHWPALKDEYPLAVLPARKGAAS